MLLGIKRSIIAGRRQNKAEQHYNGDSSHAQSPFPNVSLTTDFRLFRPVRLTHSASADSINSSPKELGQSGSFLRRLPMKLSYFDCFSCISGEMTLGDLFDAGCGVECPCVELRRLAATAWYV